MRETASWTWFFIAGIVMFALLGLHMVVQHLSSIVLVFNPAGPDTVAWNNVVYRSRSVFFTVSYIILLGAALYHGFYGLRTIVGELGVKNQGAKILDFCLWVVGIALFFFGTYAAITARALEPIY
jgi:succinate dehydrogenase/fumarate reductase cytochrome b subunit